MTDWVMFNVHFSTNWAMAGPLGLCITKYVWWNEKLSNTAVNIWWIVILFKMVSVVKYQESVCLVQITTQHRDLMRPKVKWNLCQTPTKTTYELMQSCIIFEGFIHLKTYPIKWIFYTTGVSSCRIYCKPEDVDPWPEVCLITQGIIPTHLTYPPIQLRMTSTNSPTDVSNRFWAEQWKFQSVLHL